MKIQKDAFDLCLHVAMLHDSKDQMHLTACAMKLRDTFLINLLLIDFQMKIL